MKKIILVMTSLLLVSSLALAVEEENTMNTNEAVAESTVPAAGTLSKGESFMVAFGMQESPIVGGGESGGSTTSTAATVVATTSAHTGAVVLTSSQNTPYSYK